MGLILIEATMPWPLQMIINILVPIEAVIIGFLLTRREKKEAKANKALEVSTDAQARQHEADLDAEAKFIESLMGRVSHLERQDVERQKQSELRTERLHELEMNNLRLSMTVEALKLELIGKVNTAMSTIQQQAATVLTEASKKET